MMKSIIFDVDGTLWDPTEIIMHSWNRAIAELGTTSAVITADVLKKEFGKPMDVIANNLFADANEQDRAILLDRCCQYEHDDLLASEKSCLFPNVVETIQQLSSQTSVFIVSNCQSGYIELFMEKAGIAQYITDYECFGDTGLSKGKNIKLIMERNELVDAIYVGDTQGDYEATLYANIPFVYASYGFGQPEGYTYAINNIAELLDREMMR